MATSTINWSYCLHRCNQNSQLAKQLLSLLANELPTFRSLIQEAVETNDTNDIRHVIHQLNGAAASAGAQTLADEASTIERQLNINSATCTAKQLHTLLQCIKNTLADINHIEAFEAPD